MQRPDVDMTHRQRHVRPSAVLKRGCCLFTVICFHLKLILIELSVLSRASHSPFKIMTQIYTCVCIPILRVAQRYGTIAAHTRRRASVLVVFVGFCVQMHSFAGLRTPPPTFTQTAITDRHSDTTIFQLRAYWVRISWSIGSEKSFEHVPPVGVEPSTSCAQGEHPIHQARLSASQIYTERMLIYKQNY